MEEQKISNSIFDQAKKYIPTYLNLNQTPMAELPFISRGRDSRITDADNKTYIDYVCSNGDLILGHANYRVVSAIRDIALNGFAFGFPYPLEIELAKMIAELVPSVDQIQLLNSPEEAQALAIFLTKVYARKDYVLVISNDDSAHQNIDNLHFYAKYNDLSSLEQIITTHKEKIAAILVEPIPTSPEFLIPEQTFLLKLRDISKKNNIILIFDESKSNFRIGIGGAQTILEVTPDLTIFGGLIGGGLPSGALGGDFELMSLLDNSMILRRHSLNLSPLALAAGIETITELSKPDTYLILEDLAKHLENGFQWIKNEHNLPIEIKRFHSFFSISFPTENSPWPQGFIYNFFTKMFSLGHYIPVPNSHPWYISLSHTKKEIESTIDTANEVLRNKSALT